MQEQYQPEIIEPEIQSIWENQKIFEVTEDNSKEKFYCLSMFPYPSGKLHMGHVRNYTIGDVISRFQRMQGKNVLQPMGWDAFGLPAENAALNNKAAPSAWTYKNIDYMKGQLKRLGFAYDWTREVTTCKSDYYHWEQWLFIQLWKKGLVYRKTSVVNWDPVDQTVLANEQVIEGRGWRSGALVERKEIPQWFIKITEYAEELLEEIDNLAGWPESVKKRQKDWIGKSQGLELHFNIVGEDNALTVFTTRPDTLMGVTYVAIAAEHPLMQKAVKLKPELQAFVEECSHMKTSEADIATQEKKGFDTGLKAIHPVTGQEIPIWTANFVLMGYGTGAVMSVPAHDDRDFEFAQKYQLKIQPVIKPKDNAELDYQKQAFTEKGVLFNSGDWNALTSEQAFEKISEYFETQGKGQRRTNFRLRDWGVSRQRYWGTPIPVIYCDTCDAVPVPDQDLPVQLPQDIILENPGSPLTTMPEFYEVTCPKCGAKARRETDTFDTFFESSWYYARYTAPDAQAMLDERAHYWLPVDQYIGGDEHAVMHLLYARFFHKLMRDVGLVKENEPFTRLLTQGMVVAEHFYREDETGKKTYFYPDEIAIKQDEKGKVIAASLKEDGQPVVLGGVTKMSKSKNNGVDPQPMIEKYGADTLRLFMMFTSPPELDLEWLDAGVEGAHRFLKKVWRLVYQYNNLDENLIINKNLADINLTEKQKKLRRKVYQTIQKATDDIGRRYNFNTAIAACMELSNSISDFNVETQEDSVVLKEALTQLILLLAPTTPHICQVLWQALGYKTLLVEETWPTVDEKALIQDEIEIMVQVNGKLRDKITVSKEADQKTCEAIAKQAPNVARHLEGTEIKKIIVVPGKLVNIVAK